MPLSSNQETVKVSEDLIAEMKAAFGNTQVSDQVHFSGACTPVTALLTSNAAHARGIMVTGTFAPSSEAKSQTTAPQFNNASTPITVHFSNSTGIPQMPDTDPNANPRGFGMRFHLGERVHSDVIAHSIPLFPTRTGQGFLEFLRAVAASPPGTPSPSPIEQFLGANPTALAFVQAEKLPPASFTKKFTTA